VHLLKENRLYLSNTKTVKGLLTHKTFIRKPGCGLNYGNILVQFPSRARGFLLLQSAQTLFVAHPVPLALIPQVRLLALETCYPPPSNVGEAIGLSTLRAHPLLRIYAFFKHNDKSNLCQWRYGPLAWTPASLAILAHAYLHVDLLHASLNS
jgi:hypothetical protein